MSGAVLPLFAAFLSLFAMKLLIAKRKKNCRKEREAA
jgi:hypothetical protein